MKWFQLEGHSGGSGWRDNRLALSKVGERQDGLRKSWFFNQTNHTLLTREKLENDIKFGWFVGLMESDMPRGEEVFFHRFCMAQ